jgi:hypothetical protein
MKNAKKGAPVGSSNLFGVRIMVENTALIDALSSLVDALDDAPYVIQRFVHRLLCGGKSATVHSYRDPATGTGNLRAVFEPSDLLTELVFALRAMNRDFSIIEYHKLRGAMPPNDKIRPRLIDRLPVLTEEVKRQLAAEVWRKRYAQEDRANARGTSGTSRPTETKTPRRHRSN